jgi:acetylglutamate kinase
MSAEDNGASNNTLHPDGTAPETGRIVIKYGGNAMQDQAVKRLVVEDIVYMKKTGLEPVVVHGGGPAVSEQMEKEGVEPEFVHGQRKTDEETLEIAEKVLSGKVNKELVRLVNEMGEKAVGISGKDGRMIRAHKLEKEIESGDTVKMVDLGRVGEVYEVDTTLIESLLDEDFIPIISPICTGEDDNDFNVNADMLAGEVASNIDADSLVYLTNVNGIREREDDPDSRIKSLQAEEAASLIGTVVQGGMIPKVESAVKAVNAGVDTVRIIDGTAAHSLKKSFEGNRDVGTVIYSTDEGERA